MTADWMITGLMFLGVIGFGLLTGYAYLKSPLVRHWKSVGIGVLLTIGTSFLYPRPIFHPDGALYGFPLKFVTLYAFDDVAFYQKFSFDLALFYVNILFWSLMVCGVLKAVKQK